MQVVLDIGDSWKWILTSLNSKSLFGVTGSSDFKACEYLTLGKMGLKIHYEQVKIVADDQIQ